VIVVPKSLVQSSSLFTHSLFILQIYYYPYNILCSSPAPLISSIASKDPSIPTYLDMYAAPLTTIYSSAFTSPLLLWNHKPLPSQPTNHSDSDSHSPTRQQASHAMPHQTLGPLLQTNKGSRYAQSQQLRQRKSFLTPYIIATYLPLSLLSLFRATTPLSQQSESVRAHKGRD
jgi:hypothetical protein